jgi:hypothetical protein
MKTIDNDGRMITIPVPIPEASGCIIGLTAEFVLDSFGSPRIIPGY